MTTSADQTKSITRQVFVAPGTPCSTVTP
jgi:hypothetical protein